MTSPVVGIGASPLMLLRAVRLAEDGHPVTLLDRATSPGGAWGARDLLGCANVEFGAHLLENRPALYRMLRDRLGVTLAPDPCVSMLGGRRLPMSWTRAGFHAAVGLRALARGEPDKLVRLWRSAARAGLSRSRFLYPPAGASAIVQALCDRFRDAGGQIRLGVSVDAIDVNDRTVRVRTDAGDEVATRALISSRAFAPVSVAGVVQSLGVERGVCRNVVMRVKGGGGAPFSYVEILGHRQLKRVRDLSALVRPRVEMPERILCVQHRSAMVGDAAADARVLADELMRVGLLATVPQVADAIRTDVELTTLTDATLARLERASGGRIEALPSTDLADGFMDRRDRLAVS